MKEAIRYVEKIQQNAVSRSSANKLIISFLICTSLLTSCKEKTYRDEIYEKPPIDPHPVLRALSAEESLKTMYVPKGYRIELVASDPMIAEPVAIAWDGNGKMYVAQMTTYMQDIDGTNENEPWSKISVLEDTDDDGRMDKSTTFIDSMVLPRIMLPLDERILVGETYQRDLYTYRDTNGDGKADEKSLLLKDTTRDNRNLEHQDANMIWGLDNWLYVTNKAFRYRFTNNTLSIDTLPEPVRGQWGLTQDETGRLFFSKAGGEIPASGFQQHPQYGNMEMENHWDESFMVPWPIVGTPDVQGGAKRMKPVDSTLNKFTGVAGQEVYLGDKMPGAYGDLFIPEPVGRIVRRAKVHHKEGKIFLENPYLEAEFLASTDPLFRPVYAATGPDGCLYIVDMYRGIIQEGNWVGEGSYLRKIVQEKGYDKFAGRGRIYRIIHEDMQRGPKPDLLNKSSEELLSYLGHPNGWWRTTAQKLIILKSDKSVVPDLIEIVEDNESFITGMFSPGKDFGIERLHALWTLEGLNAIDQPVLKKAFGDKDHRVRVAAIRISDRYLKSGDDEMFGALKALADDPHPEVLQQLILSFRIHNEATKPVVKSILEKHSTNELIKLTAGENLNPSFSELEALKQKYKLRGPDASRIVLSGYKIFKDYCSACHGADGKGIKQLAPPLVGSPRVTGNEETAIKILLHGLTGPVDGVEYTGPMAPLSQQSDQYIADVLSYVRNHLNNSSTIPRARVMQVRNKFSERNKYWTLQELRTP